VRTLGLLLIGLVASWAALGVDWSEYARAQESPARGAERSIRRERDGVLRRRRILPPREAAAPTPETDAPPFEPSGNDGARPYVPPGFESQSRARLNSEEIVDRVGEPVAAPTRIAPSSFEAPGRFQVAAYGTSTSHGCYVVDTVTGQTWHIANGQPPQVVVSGLTPHAPQPAAPISTPTLTQPPILNAPNEASVLPQPANDAAD
jgi:hypothetical protein